MNTNRLLDRAALTTTVTGGLLLIAAPAAFAGPAPIEPEFSGVVGDVSGGGSAGTTFWEVVTIGAAGAVLAVLVALIVVYATQHRSAKHPPARTA